ncbi:MULTISPECIES: hypothetical protein [unclassified Anabaena]|uniref:hypothetical protein n=1 Tax=unclassified Anabaena TaxID=2619674 RepID=UPI001445A8D9|nr:MULTISPECIES: hypothetical protein [unclassified Anabaena]MTJ06204.1 hypothetical protein [Anabaena sp. UHCC 0204]MTJ54707.1 hypothetical protein [Anabaena sp. UHCC 0253]
MIEIKKSASEIGFRVPTDIFQQIKNWEYSVDKIVFEEQLATGSFKGFNVSSSMKQIMQMAQEEGKIMPYYGAGGSSGACIYYFQVKDNKCNLQVYHSVTDEALVLDLVIKKLDFQAPMDRTKEIQFSFLPFVTDEPLEHPWTGERNPTMICKIFGQEYESLKQWSNWIDEEALTSRYIYQFGQVSMGATGFSIVVKDTQHGNSIDISDYDSW